MFNLSDRVRETSLTEGSGSVTINDTYGGFQSFASGVGNGNETFYAIENNVRFEIGLGTFNDGVLSRDLIFTSTDPSGNKINLDGVSTVFCTYPATHSVFVNPDGNVSGLLPRYSGIACPDGLVQTRAFIGSGNTGNVAYWSDENTIGGDDTFIWDSSDATLYIDGNLAVSGSIKDAQFYSSSAGSLFHAYIDNGGNDIVALHITDESDPTWKLGLKPYSTAFADAPTNGYVYGDIDSIGNVVDTDNFYIMNYSNGFFLTHRGANLLYIAKSNGVSINNSSSIEVPLTINSALGQSSNLQEFKNSTGNTLLSVDKAGSLVFDTQIANVTAPNKSLFYSSDNDKLVFKDKNGSIHELY